MKTGFRFLLTRSLYFIPIALLFFISPSLSEEIDSPEVKIVLIIHSYHKGFNWTDGIDSGIRMHLRTDNKIEIYTEYLDTKRRSLESVTFPFVSFIKHKYEKISPDLLILADNNALTLYKEFHKTLFPQTPVVFCGINNYTPDLIKGFENRASGVVEELDPAGTVNLILKLQPHPDRLIVISGTTPTAQAVKKDVKKALGSLKAEIKIKWWNSLSTSELQHRLEEVSINDAILLILFSRDSEGNNYSNDDAAKLISSKSKAPVYGMWDFYIGHGIAGGMMASSGDQGRAAGRLALTILRDGIIPQIIQFSPNIALFDYKVLKKHSLNPGNLPYRAKLVNKPLTEQKWPGLLIIILSVLLVATAIYSIVVFGQPLWSGSQIRLAKLITRNLQGVIVAFSACLFAALFIHSWSDYNTSVSEVRNQLIKHKKELLKIIVNQCIDEINFNRADHTNDHQIKSAVVKRLNSISFAKGEGYIFAADYNGVILVNRPNPGITGKNLYNLTDPNGVRLVEELIKAAKKPEGGFVSYIWKKPGSGKQEEKLSYAMAYHDWGWIIGTGLYIDDIDRAVSNRKEALRYSLTTKLIIIIGLGLTAIFGMTIISRFLARTMDSELNRLISRIDDTSGIRGSPAPCDFRIAEFSHISKGASLAFSTVSQLQTNLRNFFDTVNDFLFVLDTKGHIIEINKTVTERLGYRNDELTGLSVLVVHPENRREEAVRAIEDILSNKTDICTIPLQSKTGTLLEVETSVQKGQWNGSPALFGVSKDVSELKRSEASLANVIQGTSIGTWEWNIKDGKTTFNRHWAEMIGYTPEELEPFTIRTWQDHTHPEDLKHLNILLADHFNGRIKVFDYEYRMKHKNGYWVWVHDRGRITSKANDGSPLIMSGTHADITGRKRSEEKLQKTLTETNRLNKLMNGREKRVVEIKKEVNDLLRKMGFEPRYKSVEERDDL